MKACAPPDGSKGVATCIICVICEICGLIYNLTIYNVLFIYNLNVLQFSRTLSPPNPPLFIEGVPAGRGRYKRSA